MTSPSREPLSNYPENQFSTKEKAPSIAAKPHFSNRAYWKHRSQRHATLRDFPDVTCSSCIGLKLRNYMSCSNKRGLQLQALGFRVQHKNNLIKRFSVFISMYKLFSQNKQKKIMVYAWAGATPVSDETEEWLQSLVVRRMTFLSPEYRRTGKTRPSLRYVISHFLFAEQRRPQHHIRFIPLLEQTSVH